VCEREKYQLEFRGIEEEVTSIRRGLEAQQTGEDKTTKHYLNVLKVLVCRNHGNMVEAI